MWAVGPLSCIQATTISVLEEFTFSIYHNNYFPGQPKCSILFKIMYA